MTAKEFFLALPYEIKIEILRSAIREDFPVFIGLSRYALEAPLSEGGIETEVIQAIEEEYNLYMEGAKMSSE